MCEIINHLKNLTDNLPPVPTLVDLIHDPDNIRSYVEYSVSNGTAIGFGLLNQPEVAVQKIFISKGSIFPQHEHDVIEIGVIFAGEVEINVGDTPIRFRVGDVIKLQKNERHSVKAIDDSWIIAIVIPRDDGYPK